MRSLVRLGFLVVLLLPAVGAGAGLAPGEYQATGGYGSLKVTPTGKGDLRFAIEAEGANGHQCALEGELPSGALEATLPTESGPCLVRFVPQAKPRGYSVQVPDAAAEACQQFCGARATFTQSYFVVDPACQPKAMSATRARFKQAYRQKNFEAAAALLRPLLGKCVDFLSDYQAGFVRNDLALAQHHAGDDAGCLQTLAPLRALAGQTDAQIREDYAVNPSLLDDKLSVAKATRTNLQLCAKPRPSATEGGFHPIVIAPDLLLGGVADHRWVALDELPKIYRGKPVKAECDSTKHRLDLGGIKGGETYRLFTATAAVGTGTGSWISYNCDGAANDNFNLDIKPASRVGKAWLYAVGGDWNLLPRVAKKVKGRYVVDVDGDGKEEVLRVTTKGVKAEPGEPPASVVTYTLEMNGKKLRLNKDELDGTYSSDSAVAILDLNGDGVLDFLFTTSGANLSILVIDVSSGKARKVLGFYAGD